MINNDGLAEALGSAIGGMKRDAARLDWLAMYGSFGVDSVSGIPGGNGQKRVAATRAEIDAAMLKTPNVELSGLRRHFGEAPLERRVGPRTPTT